MGKILITGVAGFIGSHLSETLLKEKYEIIGVDCFTDYYQIELKKNNIRKSLNMQNFSFLETDILQLSRLDQDIEYIFHVAAQPGVRASWGGSFDVYVRDNILATQHLLELCKEQKNLKKFIYSSSSSIYGDAEAFPTREDSIPRPISPYGVTKLAGEHLCQLYHKNYGILTVSLRYFTVFGPRQRPDMAFHKFIRAILEGNDVVVFGDGEQSRDFSYIADVVEANLLSMKEETKSNVYNIGGGNHATVNEVLEILQDLTGKKATIEYREKAKGDVRNTKADISRAITELRFSPRYDLTYGLKQEIEWIKRTFKV